MGLFLLQLERPVEFSDKVQIVPLPEGSEVPDGASLQVSGFGIYRSQRPIMGIIVGSPLSSYLRKLDVTTISKTECQKTWDEKRPSYGVKITDDHLCTSTDVDTKGYCNVRSLFMNLFPLTSFLRGIFLFTIKL